MKRIFISYPFSQSSDVQRRRLDAICKSCTRGRALTISPRHLFAFIPDDDNRRHIDGGLLSDDRHVHFVYVFGDSPDTGRNALCREQGHSGCRQNGG
jgi:hypothetical protein